MPSHSLSDRASLKRRILAFYRTWSLLDMEKMAPFYSRSPGLVIFNDVEPVKFDGWSEFAEAEKETMDKFSWRKTTAKDLRVTTWGDAALTTATPVLATTSQDGMQR